MFVSVYLLLSFLFTVLFFLLIVFFLLTVLFFLLVICVKGAAVTFIYQMLLDLIMFRGLSVSIYGVI